MVDVERAFHVREEEPAAVEKAEEGRRRGRGRWGGGGGGGTMDVEKREREKVEQGEGEKVGYHHRLSPRKRTLLVFIGILRFAVDTEQRRAHSIDRSISSRT